MAMSSRVLVSLLLSGVIGAASAGPAHAGEETGADARPVTVVADGGDAAVLRRILAELERELAALGPDDGARRERLEAQRVALRAVLPQAATPKVATAGAITTSKDTAAEGTFVVEGHGENPMRVTVRRVAPDGQMPKSIAIRDGAGAALTPAEDALAEEAREQVEAILEEVVGDDGRLLIKRLSPTDVREMVIEQGLLDGDDVDIDVELLEDEVEKHIVIQGPHTKVHREVWVIGPDGKKRKLETGSGDFAIELGPRAARRAEDGALAGRIARLEAQNRHLQKKLEQLGQRVERLTRALGERAGAPRDQAPRARRRAPQHRGGGTDDRLERIEALLERLLEKMERGAPVRHGFLRMPANPRVGPTLQDLSSKAQGRFGLRTGPAASKQGAKQAAKAAAKAAKAQKAAQAARSAAVEELLEESRRRAEELRRKLEALERDLGGGK